MDASAMTPERESALDHLLDPAMWGDAGLRGENVDYIECPPRERIERAREELAALRARVEDLELLWRGSRGGPCTVFFEGPGIAAFGRTPNRWSFQKWNGSHEDPEYTDLCEPVPDDGTGLPLLTAEARRALRGENEGKVST